MRLTADPNRPTVNNPLSVCLPISAITVTVLGRLVSLPKVISSVYDLLTRLAVSFVFARRVKLVPVAAKLSIWSRMTVFGGTTESK